MVIDLLDDECMYCSEQPTEAVCRSNSVLIPSRPRLDAESDIRDRTETYNIPSQSQSRSYRRQWRAGLIPSIFAVN